MRPTTLRPKRFTAQGRSFWSHSLKDMCPAGHFRGAAVDSCTSVAKVDGCVWIGKCDVSEMNTRISCFVRPQWNYRGVAPPKPYGQWAVITLA